MSKITCDKKHTSLSVGYVNWCRESGNAIFGVDYGCDFPSREKHLKQVFLDNVNGCDIIGHSETSDMFRVIQINDKALWEKLVGQGCTFVDNNPNSLGELYEKMEVGEICLVEDGDFHGAVRKLKPWKSHKEYINQFGYETMDTTMNPGKSSVGISLSWKSDKLHLKQFQVKYLSNTPDIPSGGDGWGRSSIFAEFYQVIDGKFAKDQKTIWAVFPIFSMRSDDNESEFAALKSIVNEMIPENAPCVIFGDFNVFVDRGSAGNENILTTGKKPFEKASTIMVASDGNSFPYTYFGFERLDYPILLESKTVDGTLYEPYKFKQSISKGNVQYDENGNEIIVESYPMDMIFTNPRAMVPKGPCHVVTGTQLRPMHYVNEPGMRYSDHSTLVQQFELL
jgi:hypothetical protein